MKPKFSLIAAVALFALFSITQNAGAADKSTSMKLSAPKQIPKVANSRIKTKSDLTITKVKMNPTAPTTKDNISFIALIVNNGTAAAPASKAAVFVGGETNPVKINVPALAPGASHTIMRKAQLNKPGRYRTKIIADANGAIHETKEDNNKVELDFRVIHPFYISKQSLLTYTFPGSNNFTVELRPSVPVDPNTVHDNKIQVSVKYFKDGALNRQETLPGTFTSQYFMRWNSNPTPIAGLCTSTSTSYCLVDVTLQDTIKSQDGDILDGDGNGQPGGVYRHTFHRGMVQP